jgi:Flp pilus assembly protein TadG
MKTLSLNPSSAHDSQAGVAVVEFALVIPIVLIVLIAILDFGKAFNYWNDQTHLASEASRFAAVDKNPSTSGETLQQYVAAQADTSELRSGGTSAVGSPVQVCIDFPNGTSNVGDPVRVTVQSSYNFAPILKDAFAGALTKTLRATSTMRIERSGVTGTPANYTANPC